MIINRYAKGGGLSPRIVVSVKTGTTVTCSKGATTLTATSVDGKCSFNVNDYGVWTVSTDSDTQTVNVEYVQLYEVALKTISGTLNDNDWATIKEVADQSKGANYWAVGDTKQITINGKLSDGLTLSNYQTWVYIIGFDHNSAKEGKGKVSSCWVFCTFNFTTLPKYSSSNICPHVRAEMSLALNPVEQPKRKALFNISK